MSTSIDRFRGRYGFLSNFYTESDGSCLEMKYQAAKAIVESDRVWILSSSSPREAKRRGKEIKTFRDWDERKVSIMLSLVREKFHREPMRTWLLETGENSLQEGNFHGDNFWGVCPPQNFCCGENRLGQILMQVRTELRDGEEFDRQSL